jgi:hypothetical protein
MGAEANKRRMLGAAAVVLYLGVLLIAAGPARAQEIPKTLTDTDRSAIRSVIEAQIHAFQRDDGPAAFALASPSIQSQFRTADNFLRMVRDSYQAVYRPRKYQFLELGMVDGYLMQKVALIGPDGLAAIALYPMVKMPNGEWRTDGCYLKPLASQGA